MKDKKIDQLQENYYQTKGLYDQKKEGRILILGIGNYLMGDEGVGVHSIHRLANMDLPNYVDILDGATGSFELIPILSAYDKVIMIDATMDQKKPGNITVIYPHFAADFPIALSSHDIGLKDLLYALEFKGEMPRLILITVTIKEILALKIELSDAVQNALDHVAEKALSLAKKIHQGTLLHEKD